jgi:deoxycytidylate deaminase
VSLVLDTMVLHATPETAMRADVLGLHTNPSDSLTNESVGPRCNRGEGGGVSLSTCLCIHAEENALLEAGRERIREGAILYCDT